MAKEANGGGNLLKNIIISFIVFCIVIFTTVVSYGSFIGKKIKGSDIEAKKVNINEPVNILLLGVDAGDYENKSGNSPKRSDTIMLVRYNPENKKVYMLSIPRDTKINANGHTEKINAVHAIGGVPLVIKTIEKMFGIKINYYAKVDYVGFKKCIDSIGGVDVVIPQDMDYDAYDIHIHFKKGETVHLDGEKAERFVRWRKNNDGGGYATGDLGRISTQQEFMIKVIDKLKTPAGIIRIPSLINTLSEYVKTNMDSKTMLRYAVELRNIDSSRIEKKVLEGEPKYVGGISYFIWSSEKNKGFLENFKISSEKDRTIDKSNIKIIILNSTGKSGLALQYKNKLESLGYDVVEIGNYNKKLNSSVINDYSKKGYGDTVCSDIEFGKVIEKEGGNDKADVVVILGRDVIK